jgi:hypothetical protein
VNGLETVVSIALAAWVALLTLVAILCVRQLVIVTRRVEVLSGSPISEDGLPIGATIPRSVRDVLPLADVAYVLLMSSTCGSCK